MQVSSEAVQKWFKPNISLLSGGLNARTGVLFYQIIFKFPTTFVADSFIYLSLYLAKC